MTKVAGSGSASGSGSISQRHGSADPDPHQNVMDPEHCPKVLERLFLTVNGSHYIFLFWCSYSNCTNVSTLHLLLLLQKLSWLRTWVLCQPAASPTRRTPSSRQRHSPSAPMSLVRVVCSSVVDPYSDWIPIQGGPWIRIRIRNPYPDPGGQK